MNKIKLKLFITGQTANSSRAIGTIKRICDEYYPDEHELSIIDVLEHPQIAEDEKILATPTLIKFIPPPKIRIIGDMSDRDRVLTSLDLHPAKNNGEKER
jgi:circadian clock protein KaiB